jgi:hypothetical protein
MSDEQNALASESYRIADEKLKILRRVVDRQVRGVPRNNEESRRQAAG